MPIQKIKSGRVLSSGVNDYIGNKGQIFYDEDIGELRLSDGVAPGGISITLGGGGAGPTGPQGPQGITGPQGPQGRGVPAGGITGQSLVKVSSTDYDTTWATVTGGGANFVGNFDGGYPDSNYGGITSIDAGGVSG
jgi:hypothetical protein